MDPLGVGAIHPFTPKHVLARLADRFGAALRETGDSNGTVQSGGIEAGECIL